MSCKKIELYFVNRERENRNVGFEIEKRVVEPSCVGASHFISHLFLCYTVSLLGVGSNPIDWSIYRCLMHAILLSNFSKIRNIFKNPMIGNVLISFLLVFLTFY